MSGGEPSSIKRISDCEQVTCFVMRGSLNNKAQYYIILFERSAVNVFGIIQKISSEYI